MIIEKYKERMMILKDPNDEELTSKKIVLIPSIPLTIDTNKKIKTILRKKAALKFQKNNSSEKHL